MASTKLKLLACYEGVPFDGAYSPFHRLYGRMNNDELWAYLIAQCEYGGEQFKPETLNEAVDYLLNEESAILAGGLVAIKSDFKLFPGCCCGIENWRAWRSIKKGGYSPWLGHDPDPWIDTTGDAAVLHKDLEEESASIEVDYDELRYALDKVEKDFHEFLSTMNKWLKEEGIKNADTLTKKIDQWYHISA